MPDFGARKILPLLTIIPARGGSKGLPDKNLRCVGGRPLVVRAIETARAWQEAGAPEGRLIVDTDDPRIAEVAIASGADVPFLREAEYARDDTPTVASVLRLLDRLAPAAGDPEHLLLLQPTSPLRSPDDLSACWAASLRSGHSAVSVSPLGRSVTQLLHLDADGRIRWAVAPPTSSRRQDAEAAWYPNGAVYFIRSKALRADRAFVVAGRTVGVPIPPWRAVDVDDEAGLRFADGLARVSAEFPERAP